MGRLKSFGTLMYRKNENGVQYLLGKIPQGNVWTVFKGMPESDESPHETALREFQEETGSTGVLTSISPDAPVLHGQTGRKDLVIHLLDGSNVSESIFNLQAVVKIDSGYMSGRPEIIAIQWMTLAQAFRGMDGAKVYKSQKTILEQAESILAVDTDIE